MSKTPNTKTEEVKCEHSSFPCFSSRACKASPLPPVSLSWEEEFDDKFIKMPERLKDDKWANAFYPTIKQFATDIKTFFRSVLAVEISRARKEIIDSLKERIEDKYGKFGTFSGSFGYQGIVMGVRSFQTEYDKARDDILSFLSEDNNKE